MAVSGRVGQPRAHAAGRATVPRTDRELDGQRPSPAVRAVKPCVGIKRSNWVSGLSGQPLCRVTGPLNTATGPRGFPCRVGSAQAMRVKHWNRAGFLSLLGFCGKSPSSSECAPSHFAYLLRCCGPQQVAQIDLRPSVERTSAENASTRIHLGVSDRSTLLTTGALRPANARAKQGAGVGS